MALRICLIVLFAFGSAAAQVAQIDARLVTDEAEAVLTVLAKHKANQAIIQGPWYTVGWKMAVVIEKTFGRAKLIECFCDQRKLLAKYNEAAAKHNRSSAKRLALWSKSIVDALRG